MDIPLGQTCPNCGDAFTLADIGVTLPLGGQERPVHLCCYYRLRAGGANHQRGHCQCYGGDRPADPPGLSPREAAELAMKTWWELDRKQRHLSHVG